MENTTITRSFDFTLETIDFIISQLDQLDEIQRVMGIGRSREEQITFDNLRQILLDASADINRQIEEESKPKYEHRYAVRGRDGNPIQEYDTLKEAWEIYKEYYENDYNRFMSVDYGDYEIYDNKLDKGVTKDVPFLDFEYYWAIDLDLRLDGSTVDASDAPSSVMDNIAECFACGDDNGYLSEEVGDISWDDIADWEIDNEETEEVEEATSVPAESTETEEETEPDNTWHIY